MSFKLVGNLRDDLAGLLAGTNLNNVTNFYGACERALRTMAQQIDVPEVSGRQAVMLYDGVYDYYCSPDIFGGALTDFRPQGVSRNSWDYAYKKPVELFDRTKHLLPNGFMVTFEHRNGVPIMRVASPYPTQRLFMDPMADTTGWAAGGDASGLAKDTTVYYDAPASLRFNLSAAGSLGTLTKTLSNTLNFTNYNGVGMVFLATWITDITALISLRLRVGSDSSNYFEVTATQAFLGSFIQQNFTSLVSFDLSTATQTGTVDVDSVDYVQIGVAYNGTAMANFRFGGIWASLPTPAEMLYQSSSIFIPQSSTAPQQTINNDNDTIILNDAAYNIYIYEAAIAVAEQSGASVSSPTIDKYTSILYGDPKRPKTRPGLYALYRGDNPSEELRTVGSYYEIADNG